VRTRTRTVSLKKQSDCGHGRTSASLQTVFFNAHAVHTEMQVM
jgi:hypothetical protein